MNDRFSNRFSYTSAASNLGGYSRPQTILERGWSLRELAPFEDNYIYISHLDNDYKFWRIPVTPDEITDNMDSNFGSVNALGRSAPVYTYSHSGPRSMTVTINLHRDLMDDVNQGWSNAKLGYGEDYIDNLVKALQAISLPKYNLSNKAVEPPLVAIRFSNDIFIKGVVNGSISVTYSGPILSNNKRAAIKISFSIYEVDPYDATSVFKNGSFRGVVATLRNRMGLNSK